MNFVQGICFNNSPGGSGENGSSTPELGSMAAAGGSGDPDPDGKPPKKDDCNCELYKEKEQNAAEYLKKAELDYHDRGLCKTDSCTPLSHEHQIDYKLGQIEASITNNHKYGYCEKNIPVTSTPAESLKKVPLEAQSLEQKASTNSNKISYSEIIVNAAVSSATTLVIEHGVKGVKNAFYNVDDDGKK